MTPEVERHAKIVVALTEARPVMRRFMSADSCILSTRVGLEVLRYFGIAAQPAPVEAGVFNAPAYKAFLAWHSSPVERRGPMEWGEDGWAVGIDSHGNNYVSDVKGGRWGGHLVLETDLMLIDLSLDQFHRPAKGIVTDPPGAIATPVNEVWLTHGVMLLQDEESGTGIAYSRMTSNAEGYRSAPDWRLKGGRQASAEYRRIIATIINHIRGATSE